MNNSKIILIDMDMVLNKFWKSYETQYNKITSKNISIHTAGLHQYTVSKNFEDNEKEALEINEKILSTKEFWSEMEIFENAYEVMEELTSRYLTLIVTRPWEGYDECATEKIKWIKKYLPFFDIKNVIFTSKKHLIKSDIMIDDDHRNFSLYDGIKIIMDYPYNRNYKADYRVQNWLQIRRVIFEDLEANVKQGVFRNLIRR
jgi:5'(3')-deoxyribonucleotidase